MDYGRLSSTARRLLMDHGQAITLRRVSGGTYTPSSDTYSGQTTTTLTAYGVVRDYRADQVDGAAIRRGDRFLVLDATVTPTLADTVLMDDGAYWSIVHIESKNPAGTPVAHIVQVRR